MKQVSLNFNAPASKGDISVGSIVFCRSREASGVVLKIYGKSLLINRDDKYITKETRGDGSVYVECDKWVGKVDNWTTTAMTGEGQ